MCFCIAFIYIVRFYTRFVNILFRVPFSIWKRYEKNEVEEEDICNLSIFFEKVNGPPPPSAVDLPAANRIVTAGVFVSSNSVKDVWFTMTQRAELVGDFLFHSETDASNYKRLFSGEGVLLPTQVLHHRLLHT